MIVIVTLVFVGSLVTAWKLDLGHAAIVDSLNSFSSLAAPSAVYSAIEMVRMFSSLDFRRLSKSDAQHRAWKTPVLNMERDKGREVIDRETEGENWDRAREREREKKGRKEGNHVFVPLFTDTVY